MLLQSHAGELDLLPALPRAWPVLERAAVRSGRGEPCQVRYGPKAVQFEIRAGASITLDGTLRTR